MLRLSS